MPSKEVIENDWIDKTRGQYFKDIMFRATPYSQSCFRKAIEDNMPKPTEDKVEELIEKWDRIQGLCDEDKNLLKIEPYMFVEDLEKLKALRTLLPS